MSISQFDNTLTREVSGVARPEFIRIKVGGPLRLDPDVQYRKPIAIHFELIQSPLDPEGKEIHDPAQAKRVSDTATTDGADGRWEKFVEVPSGWFRTGEARGIGVAVLPQEGEFAYETLTWCDHLMLEVD